MRNLLSIILIMLTSYSFGQSLSATINGKAFKVGQQAKYQITFEGQNLPDWPLIEAETEISNGLEIVNCPSVDTVSLDNSTQIIATYNLTSWDSGYFVVEPFKIAIGDDTLNSNPLLVYFGIDSLPHNAPINPLKEQLDTPFIFDEIAHLVYIGIGSLILLAAIIILIIYYLNKKRGTPIQPVEVSIPVIVTLRERLTKLKAEEPWKNNNEKHFQSEISSILRGYLNLRYGIKSKESSTSEIVYQLKGLGISVNDQDVFKQLLNFSDMIKFAKHKGNVNQHELALEQLEQFLNNYQSVE